MPLDTPALYNGEEFAPDGFLLRCLFFHESLLHPKPCPEIWVRCMMRWLKGPAREWAEYLAKINPCMKDTENFGTMLKWLYQVTRKEKEAEKLHDIFCWRAMDLLLSSLGPETTPIAQRRPESMSVNITLYTP